MSLETHRLTVPIASPVRPPAKCTWRGSGPRMCWPHTCISISAVSHRWRSILSTFADSKPSLPKQSQAQAPPTLLLGRGCWPAPSLLDLARTLLGRQAACLSLRGWTGRDATFRHMQGALQQVCKAFYDFGTVAMLTAGGLRGEVQDATRINVRFQLAQQASALRIVQTRRAEH